MNYINAIIKTIFLRRKKEIDYFKRFAHQVQQSQFIRLMRTGSSDYLRHYGINENSDYSLFRSRIPIVYYEDLASWIERDKQGEHTVLTSDRTRWFAKSSGTTNDISKYIPINKSYLNQCHYQGSKDVILTCVENFPNTKAYYGKSLILGGSQKLIDKHSGVKTGDLSAILLSNTPYVVQWLKEPKISIALMPDFEKKVEAICKSSINKNITSFAGVPSWNLVLMKRILECSGKTNLLEVWPNLSLFMHGGVAFTPYRSEYERLIPSEQMIYLETYNASEGFFALQDDPTDDSMLLMLDYGVFYEFIPLATIDDHTTAMPLEGVEIGVNYAMVISNISGLWRYVIGDTVMFTSTYPYKIKITGRTKQFINTFGEELMIDNTEKALKIACQKTNSTVLEYTVAPIFMSTTTKGSHQWFVEFTTAPNNAEYFADTLDDALQNLNSDYAAKRNNSSTMNPLTLSIAKTGTFNKWMQKRGKQGGQNKVPRLSADRVYVEELLVMNEL